MGMKSEWTAYTLGEITDLVIDHRGKTPKKLGGDWSSDCTHYRALSAKNIKTGQIVNPETIRYVSPDMYSTWMKEQVQKGDIFITSEAPFGQILYWDSDEKIVLSQRIFGIRLKKEVCSRYVYYYMLGTSFQAELDARATGTTVFGLRQPELLKCTVRLPSLPTQRKIAAILSSLDDKIENNNAICKNLEEQAAALYKSWFVDFEPFGGQRPDNWKDGTLKDLVEIKYGKDHKKLNDGMVPVYGSGGEMRRVDTAIYSDESVLIPRKGTLNNILYISNPFWTVDTMFYTRMKMDNVCKYVHQFMKRINLEGLNAGSAVPSMTTEILYSLKIHLPTDSALERFETLVRPMYKMQNSIRRQNECLAFLRDTLLPKLMSGEIEVDKVAT